MKERSLRAQVLDGLRCLRIWARCGVLDRGDCDRVMGICDGAIRLLEVHAPRVLTLAELEALPVGPCAKVPVCVEERVPVDRWTSSLYQWHGSDFVVEDFVRHGSRFYNRANYGVTWRVWSAMPDPAQRQAPWPGVGA